MAIILIGGLYEKIYYNGDILTMENSDYEAIYVEDGVIKKCGNYSEIKI